MTLKTRNRIFNFFFLASLAAVVLNIVFFALALAKGIILTPPDYRIPAFLNAIPFAHSNLIALYLSFAAITLYVPVCFFMILHYFENTQTSEIIFFTGFLIGCMTELSRFLTISFGLWQTFSNSLIFCGTIVLFGRTIVPLSFLAAALLSDSSQRQDIERNCIILVLASITFATVIPMNTAKISSTGLVTEGFMVLINILRVMLVLVSFASFYIHGIRKSNNEYKSIALSFIILISGYYILINTDTFLLLFPGVGLLFYGTYSYLKNIHKMYMWA